jgi:hypothetical protein
MPQPRPRHLAAAVAGCLALAVPALAAAPTGGTAPGGGTEPPSSPKKGKDGSNPCGNKDLRLRCPDLTLRAPAPRYFRRYAGRVELHAANSIVNMGRGPAEVFGRRIAPGVMRVVQHIYDESGARHDYPSAGRLVFKRIPTLGPYWKFENAARFELWTIDDHGGLGKMVRTGPKLVYCLRDLYKRAVLPFSPPSRHYPACNQDPSRLSVTLGTSVGWADEYPVTYYEQYIDVTGLRGRFVFVQRVDPLNNIHESNEDNNLSPRVVLNLPPPVPPPAKTSPTGGSY